jgi:transglutaminase-like putative cysteine protease
MDPFSPPFRIDDRATPQWRVNWLQQVAATWAHLPPIKVMADSFVRQTWHLHRRRDDEFLASIILEWVHDRLRYRDDPWGREYYQGIYWTLTYGGDCEDLVVALVALMLAAGLDARVVWQEQSGAPLNHVTAQVRLPTPKGPEWVWADPTVKGARLGEEPHDAAARLGQFHKLGMV